MVSHAKPAAKLDGIQPYGCLDNPCLEPDESGSAPPQKRRQRSVQILMALNILVTVLLLTFIFLDRGDSDEQIPAPLAASRINGGGEMQAASPALRSDSMVPGGEGGSGGSLPALSLADEEKLLTNLYDTAEASVVKILVARRGQINLSRPDPRGDGSGSGIVVDAGGYIVTNNHVVNQATDVVVQLSGGQLIGAEVIGSDPGTDLALLRIDVSEASLAAVPFGNSNSLRVGQTAVAIGFPFGFDKSFTVGHISGLNRSMPIKDKYIPVIRGMIQTDAAINPGNSGGPLFNLQGEVIGINSAIFSTSRGSQGVGFAIPSQTAIRVIAELRDQGYVSRPFLGLNGLPLNRERASQLDIDVDQGLLIQEVSKDSPAWQEGVRSGDAIMVIAGIPVRLGGDVLTAVDGQAIDSMRTLNQVIQDHEIGDKITLSLHRDGKNVELVTILTERPAPVRRDG